MIQAHTIIVYSSTGFIQRLAEVVAFARGAQSIPVTWIVSQSSRPILSWETVYVHIWMSQNMGDESNVVLNKAVLTI